MKTIRCLIMSFGLLTLSALMLNAQETSKNVHLKVVKNGKTTVDTVFVAEDLENEALNEKISTLSGVDLNLSHKHEFVKDEECDKSHHSYTYVEVDDCEENGERIKKKKVIIKKKGEGDIEEKDIWIEKGKKG